MPGLENLSERGMDMPQAKSADWGGRDLDYSEIPIGEAKDWKETGEGVDQNAETENLKELTPEEKLENLEAETIEKQKTIEGLQASLESDRQGIKELREELGLPPQTQDAPGQKAIEESIEKLSKEHQEIENEKNELFEVKEREDLVREEKEAILQERLDEFFHELQNFDSREIEIILVTGKRSSGENLELGQMGEINPSLAKLLIKSFKEGIKTLIKMQGILPELMTEFNESLTKEAEERADKRLDESNQETTTEGPADSQSEPEIDSNKSIEKDDIGSSQSGMIGTDAG